MRGPSFTNESLCKVLTDVHLCCQSHNAGIMCEITDGEFIKLIHTSENGHPLTHFQRLKAMFKYYEQFSRSQLVDMIIHEVHPPYTMRWDDIHTPFASDVWKQHFKKMQTKESKKSSSQQRKSMIEDLSFQDKLDLLEGTKWNRWLRSKPNVIDVQRQSGTTAVTPSSSQQRQSGTTAVGASSTQQRQSGTAAVAPSSSQQRQSGTAAIPTSSTQPTHGNYSSDLWFSTTQIWITESGHESDSNFVLNKSDEESSSTTDDDINVSIDSSEEDHVVDVPGGNLPDIPNPLLMPIHPCTNAILRALRQSKYKGKWFRESVCSLFDHFLCSREKLQKLKHLEMNIIHDELFKFFGKKIFKKTDLKSEKVNSLCRQFCPSIYIDGCLPENSQ